MVQDDKSSYECAFDAALYILQRQRVYCEPLTAVVLGSGLGAVAEAVEDPCTVDVEDIPHWPVPTAPGHAGCVVLGKLEGRPVVVMQGRIHYYEGHSIRRAAFPARVARMMGVRQYVATNASGGISAQMEPGTIAAVEDHINLMGDNPLAGPLDMRWDVQFPDLTHAYSPRLLKLLDRAADEAGVQLRRGVYAAFKGPSYETPAEIRMARMLGADLVGMSTVPEVIVANSMGLETAVLSCVANKAAGLSEKPLTAREVLSVMAKSARPLTAIIRGLMRELNREDSKEQ